MSLALSADQTRTVLAAADRIPAQWRNRFVEGVADYLFGRQPTTDADVAEAIEYVADRFHRKVESPPSPRKMNAHTPTAAVAQGCSSKVSPMSA